MADQQLATIQRRNLAAVTDFTETQVELIKRTMLTREQFNDVFDSVALILNPPQETGE